MDRPDILGYEFYGRDTGIVARELLGKVLVKSDSGHKIAGIITETEAYYGEEDPASHAFNGVTPRSEIMFGKAGLAYVYLCYGMYYLLNVVTENPGKAGAVLIRAIKPLRGIDLMIKRRGIGDVNKLADGPGKLTISLGIDINDNGKDLTKKESGINILDFKTVQEKFHIKNTARIGIKKGCEKLLRFKAPEIDESLYQS